MIIIIIRMIIIKEETFFENVLCFIFTLFDKSICSSRNNMLITVMLIREGKLKILVIILCIIFTENA